MKFYDYFQSYQNYFWQWEDNTEVIAIPQGNTIAYMEYINEVIEKLSPQGLPPFGSLLLVILATNPGGKESIEQVNSILSDTLKTADNIQLANATKFLKSLSEIPDEYKRGKKRILVFQVIFENCHHLYSIKNSRSILHDLVAKRFDTTKVISRQAFDLARFEKDFKTINVLQNKFKDTGDIIAKIASLPQFEEEILLDAPTEENKTKELTEQLIDNPKTFYVGSLIKIIWSGLNIPVHSALPSQQPIGGVSDLTNKGDYDKLLVSEYANEDIVFLSRLANNEALFIRREVPPVNNNLERIILIDTSLKNWGSPKTIAFATMLAIAKHPKSKIACSAFAIGNFPHSIDIECIDGIINGLQELEGTLNCAIGLEAFFKEYTVNKNKEIFFITEPSTMKQAAMAKVMSEYHSIINYWIFTDIEGNIDIHKKQQASKKHIQHMQLPLETLWKKEPSFSKRNRQNDELINNYPILFRNSVNVKKIINTQHGEIFQITGEKALLRFFNRHVKSYEIGWEMIIDDLPFIHGEYEIGRLANGEYVFLMFNPQNRELSLINIATKEKKQVIFNEWKSTSHQSFLFKNGKFFHLNHKGCWSIDPDGTINKDGNVELKFFIDRKTDIEKHARDFISSQGTFKNIKEIFINENNNLVFNIHELHLNVGSHIKLDMTTNKIRKVQAEKTNDFTFTFADGSTIEINKSGMFIFKSSDLNIPVIYIPSVLNASLAIATNSHFAGNEYYFNEPQYEIVLENAGTKPLKLLQTIKSLTDYSLAEVQNLVYTVPSLIAQYFPKTDADLYAERLKEDGATVKINLVKKHYTNFKIEKIDTVSQFEKTVKPFIYNILEHGSKN